MVASMRPRAKASRHALRADVADVGLAAREGLGLLRGRRRSPSTGKPRLLEEERERQADVAEPDDADAGLACSAIRDQEPAAACSLIRVGDASTPGRAAAGPRRDRRAAARLLVARARGRAAATGSRPRPAPRPAGRRGLPPSDGEGRLQVQRDRVVDERADPALAERRGERVAPRVAHHEEVVDRAGVGLLARAGSTPAPASSRGVERGERPAPLGPGRRGGARPTRSIAACSSSRRLFTPGDLVAVAVALAAVAELAQPRREAPGRSPGSPRRRRARPGSWSGRRRAPRGRARRRASRPAGPCRGRRAPGRRPRRTAMPALARERRGAGPCPPGGRRGARAGAPSCAA